jgi:hypothetical protein
VTPGQPLTPREGVILALYALKEDAMFAWKQCQEGDMCSLVPLGKAWRALEQAVSAADRKLD